MKGSDHKCSLEPNEFKAMVRAIREIETSFGSENKQMQESELQCWNKLGKSIVAAVEINKGETLTEDKLKIKVAEPKGIPARDLRSVLGKTINTHVDKDGSILEDFIC